NFDRSWALDRPFYVDLLWIPDDDRMNDGEHPLEFVFRAAREGALAPIPVIGLMRPHEYVRACRAVLEQDKRGVCLRIPREDFMEFESIEAQILELLGALSISARACDLILDLRSIGAPQPLDVDSIIRMAQAIPMPQDWRSFTIAATSFPPNLVGLPPEE